MLLLLLILFLNPVTSFESYAIDAPFKYSLKEPSSYSHKNSISVLTSKDELTGKVTVDSQFCQFSDDHPLWAGDTFVWPEENNTFDYFVWKCVNIRENGKLSAEPFRCLYKDEYRHNVEMMAGESSKTTNGSIRHYCDFANGGLRRVTEYVPGCYHNGTVYTVDQTWIEENPDDKNSSVLMGCQRGESGYFEKKVRACIMTAESHLTLRTYFENGSYIETNTTSTYEKYMELNRVELYYSQTESRELERCVETQPGHVAVVKVTEEEVGCIYKNQFHKFGSYWDDLEMGAVLNCDPFSKVIKGNCLVNGTYYHVDPQHEHKLSNGCTFICHHQKNIYKCPDQLSFLEVMKTATTRIPTTLRAELGF